MYALVGTHTHPVCSEYRCGYVGLGELEVGERVRTAEGWATVEAMARWWGSATVHNLEVEAQHRFLAGAAGVVSHNAGGGGGGGSCFGESCGRDSHPDPRRPNYSNGATHQDHIKAKVWGGTNDPANMRPLPAETNMRRGGHDAALKRYERYLMENGMSREQAREVIRDEIESLSNSPPPRPMDPDDLDMLESPR